MREQKMLVRGLLERDLVPARFEISYALDNTRSLIPPKLFADQNLEGKVDET